MFPPFILLYFVTSSVLLLQDAEELIMAMPGLTDGYYHKVL